MDSERTERRLARQPKRSGTIDLKQVKEQIERNKNQASNILEPSTLVGKLRAEFVRRVPLTSLRNRLEEAPLTSAIREMRPHLYTLYNNMGDLLREGQELTESHEEIRKLYQAALENPEDDELLQNLRDRLRHDAEKDLNIKRDSATEELMKNLFDSNDPEKKLAMRQKTLAETQEFLTFSETVTLIAESITINSAQSYETMNAQYSAFLRLQKLVEIAHKSGQDLVAAQENRVQTYNTLIGQVDSLLFSANLANEVQQYMLQEKTEIDRKRVDRLRLKALELNDKTARALPVPLDPQKKLAKPSSENENTAASSSGT